jgi:hypothetical protein
MALEMAPRLTWTPDSHGSRGTRSITSGRFTLKVGGCAAAGARVVALEANCTDRISTSDIGSDLVESGDASTYPLPASTKSKSGSPAFGTCARTQTPPCEWFVASGDSCSSAGVQPSVVA